MNQTLYTLARDSGVEIKTHGDLRLVSWESPDVGVRADTSMVRTYFEEKELHITCLDDCEIAIPAKTRVRVEKVSGDARVENLECSLDVEKVVGSLFIDKISQLRVAKVGGDGFFTNMSAGFRIGKLGGDLIGVGISGGMNVDKIGGDVFVKNLMGATRINAGGDIKVQISQEPGTGPYEFRAGGDVHLFIPKDRGINLRISSQGKAIWFKMADIEERLDVNGISRVFGNGETKIILEAGGEVFITDTELPENEITSRFFTTEIYSSNSDWYSPGFNAAKRATRRSEEIAQRAIAHVKTRIRPEDGVRSDIVIESDNLFHWDEDSTSSPKKPSNRGITSFVSDEERLLVLQMLQEKKITAKEAEQLLEALEGRGV